MDMNVAEAIRVLKENGYKYTGKREELLKFFAKNERYLTAKDVQQGLKGLYPNLSFDTIYRNLSLFQQLGILEATELDNEKHFRIACSKEEHHHHFICLECGKTKEIKTCPMFALDENFDGFTIAGHKFEVYGYCPECQKT